MLPFYAQVVGIGLLWVTVHCIGMCGPIMASLTAGMGVGQGTTVRKRVWRATRGVLSYQSGRAVVYVGLGASAGLVGAAAQELIEDLTRTAGLVVAVVVLMAGVWKLLPFDGPVRSSGQAGWAARWMRWTMRFFGRFIPASGALRMAAFGFALGFLPCVLMFWILGIAASTASPFHGAMIMLLLVAMTTPVLVLAACGASLPGVFSHLRSDRVIGAAMVISGIWLTLIAMAANGWIDHLHIPLEFVNRDLVVMLW